MPRKTTLDRGWAALCFRGQSHCEAWMEWVSARAGHFVTRTFTVQASLWGWPGVTREVVALIVPPRPGGPAPAESSADDFSASRRATG